MKLRDVIIQHLFIILFGTAILVIDYLELVHYIYPTIVVLLWALYKTYYFLDHSLKGLMRTAKDEATYLQFIRLLAVNISLVLLSFTVDYLSLYRLNPACFRGISAHTVPLQLFDFLYFSTSTFATVGYGDIVPLPCRPGCW